MIGPLSLMVLLAGCAATVKKQDGGAPVPVGTKAVGKNVVLNLTGSDETMSAKDWTGFKGIWNDECSDEFHEAEAQFSMQDGALSPRVQREPWSSSMSWTTVMSPLALGSPSE